jgi:phosphohistidine phosphatase SixA
VELRRDAEALPSSSGDEDLDRPLSPRGEQEALAAGQWLAAHGVRPDRLLCSPALRARRTAELAARTVAPTGAVGLAEEIYDATPGELLALLDQHADARCVLLVGHNPGIERLVALMVDGRSDDFRGMPPAGLAVLHLEGALEPGNARLDAFWSP